MAGGCHARAVVSFVLSEVLEDDVVKNESDDELEGLAALFLEHERKPAVRIRGYVRIWGHATLLQIILMGFFSSLSFVRTPFVNTQLNCNNKM